MILSKCSMCRKMQFDSLSSLPHAQSPHTSCLLANGLSASAEQRNKFFSAHSRLGLSWVCLLGVLSKQQAFPSCRIPLVFAGLQLPCQSLKQMEEWIGFCRDGAVQHHLLTDTHMPPAVMLRARNSIRVCHRAPTLCLQGQLSRWLVKQRNPQAQNPALGIGINVKYSPKAHKKVRQVTLPCIISPLHSHIPMLSQDLGRSVQVSMNRFVQSPKRKLKPVSAPESPCKPSFLFMFCKEET